MKRPLPESLDEPPLKRRREIYRLYNVIWETEFELIKKRSLLTSAFAYEPWGWRVVGITENAIKEIAINDFKKPSGKLCRDHSVPRKDTYNKMLQTKSIVPFEEWWKLFWRNDKTILMTNNEHQSVGQTQKKELSKIYSLDWKKGYFRNNNLVGWKHRKTVEGEYVRKLCEQNKIN
jgi:hypothetical protein